MYSREERTFADLSLELTSPLGDTAAGGSERLAAPVRAADDGNFLDKLNPFKAMEKAQEKNALAKREQEANQVINDDMRKQLFGDGLGGRVLAGMVNNVAGALKEQMGAAAAASQETYDAAERAVRSDPKMRAALGDGIQCTPPMSQMSSQPERQRRADAVHDDRVHRAGEQRGAGAGAGHGDGRRGAGAADGHQGGAGERRGHRR